VVRQCGIFPIFGLVQKTFLVCIGTFLHGASFSFTKNYYGKKGLQKNGKIVHCAVTWQEGVASNRCGNGRLQKFF